MMIFNDRLFISNTFKIYMFYFLAFFCSSLIPIPKRPTGIQFGPSSAPITFEIFTDITCPDCAADYKNIQLILAEYPTQVNFIFHFFEIPAHTWSYLLTRSIYACYKESEDYAKKILDGLFGKYEQAKFYPKALSNVGEEKVFELAKEYVISKTGIDKTTFELNYDDPDVIKQARIDFKYSFIRNLNSVPTIYVNGVKSDLGVSSSLQDWKDLINSLLE